MALLLVINGKCLTRRRRWWHVDDAVFGAGAAWAGNVVTADSWSKYDYSGRRQDDTQQYTSAVLRQFHLARSGIIMNKQLIYQPCDYPSLKKMGGIVLSLLFCLVRFSPSGLYRST